MKKVIVVSKTHLDLGFTDFASVVCETYRNTYIPNAISLARELNTPQRKRFIWTTGSWILQDTLQNGTKKKKEALAAALQRGDIVPHALPFTTHTELLDADTLEYGLSIVEKLDMRLLGLGGGVLALCALACAWMLHNKIQKKTTV